MLYTCMYMYMYMYELFAVSWLMLCSLYIVYTMHSGYASEANMIHATVSHTAGMMSGSLQGASCNGHFLVILPTTRDR